MYASRLGDLSFWIEFIFPYNIILDLTNLIFVLTLLIIIFSKYKPPINFQIFSLICCFTPLLFNNYIISPELFPDQTKYIRIASECRDLNCMNRSKNVQVVIPGIIYALSPIIGFDGFKSLAFLNRFLLIVTALYLYYRNVNKYFILALLLLPGLVLYSSISLRDPLVIITSILSFLFFIDKKYFLFAFLSLFLILLKFQNGFYIVFSCFLYSIMFSENNKINKLKKYFLSAILISIIFFSPEIVKMLDLRRYGMYHEAFTDLSYYQNIDLSNIFSISIQSFFYFIISPLNNLTNFYSLIITIDTLILYTITGIFFSEVYKLNKKKFLFWVFLMVALLAIYGIIVFNAGTIHRYKISILIPFIFAAIYSVQSKKNV